MKICLIDETGAGDGALSVLAARWGLEHDEDNLMALVMTTAHLELRKRDEPKLGGIFVDFAGGAMAHRRKFGVCTGLGRLSRTNAGTKPGGCCAA